MQVLPAIETGRQDESSYSYSLTASDNTFYDVLDQAVNSSAEAEDYPYLADSPYSENPAVFSPFVPQPVRLSQTESEQLANALAEEGVDEQVVAAIREQGAIPGGATLDQLTAAGMAAINNTTEILSKQEREQLENLLTRLTGENGREIYKALRNGDSAQALRQLQDQLKNLAEDLELSQEELLLLTKALNLSAGTRQNLLNSLNGQPQLNQSGQAWADALNPGLAELEGRKARLDQLQSALDKHSNEFLHSASKREQAERQAMQREDKSVAQSRILIEDTATQAMFARETQADQGRQTRNVGKAAEFGNPAESAEQAAARLAANARKGEKADEDQAEARQFGQDQDRNQNKNFDPKQRTNLEAQLASEARPTAGQSASQPNQIYAAWNPGGNTFGVSADPTVAAQQANQVQLPRQAAAQIEQAVLSAAKDGTQRLEVALNPVELGAITVVLTRQAGELSAVIRPDKPETTALIQQQLEQIRVELENQGLKIDKIDVETQLAQNELGWQDPERHNAWRDMSERQTNLDRMRRLSREADSSLAQPVQDMAHREIYSGNGLHLVA